MSLSLSVPSQALPWLSPSLPPLLTPDVGSGPHSELPKFKECLRAVTQTRAADLSRNLSMNCVDLGWSPKRSPRGKRNPSGSGRAEGEHLGGGGQPQPPADTTVAGLGTRPLGQGGSCHEERFPMLISRA